MAKFRYRLYRSTNDSTRCVADISGKTIKQVMRRIEQLGRKRTRKNDAFGWFGRSGSKILIGGYRGDDMPSTAVLGNWVKCNDLSTLNELDGWTPEQITALVDKASEGVPHTTERLH